MAIFDSYSGHTQGKRYDGHGMRSRSNSVRGRLSLKNQVPAVERAKRFSLVRPEFRWLDSM